MAEFALKIALILLPLYITNACAMFFAGEKTLDLGKKLWGRQLLGGGKTFRGTFLGLVCGMLSGFILEVALPETTAEIAPEFFAFAAMLSLGAIMGDLAASFLKRRLGIERGKPVLFLDQLDFVAGGIIFGYWIYQPGIPEMIAMAVVTIAAHRIANFIAFKIKIKKVPW